MKIKHKLWVGFTLLFIAVAFFGILSMLFIKQMSASSDVILEDNYATLRYVREMREALEESDLPLAQAAITRFEQALSKEENNITEPGEKDAVLDLRTAFERLKNGDLPLPEQEQAEKAAFKSIRQIVDLNLDAIEMKSAQATQATKNAGLYLGLLAGLTFLVLFSLIFNIVGFFEEPFKRLVEGLRNMSAGKYTLLQYDKNDELGDVYQAYNELSRSIEMSQKQTEEKIATEQLRTEVLMKHIDYPVIIIDNKNEVVSINQATEKVFDVKRQAIVGQPINKTEIDTVVRDMSTENTAIRTIHNQEYLLSKEAILVPSGHISAMEEGEIEVMTQQKEEIIFLKRK